MAATSGLSAARCFPPKPGFSTTSRYFRGTAKPTYSTTVLSHSEDLQEDSRQEQQQPLTPPDTNQQDSGGLACLLPKALKLHTQSGIRFPCLKGAGLKGQPVTHPPVRCVAGLLLVWLLWHLSCWQGLQAREQQRSKAPVQKQTDSPKARQQGNLSAVAGCGCWQVGACVHLSTPDTY